MIPVAELKDPYTTQKPLYWVKEHLDYPIAGCDQEKLMTYALLYTHKFNRQEDRAHLAVTGISSVGKSWLLLNVARAYNFVTGEDVKAIRKRKNAIKAETELFNARDGIALTGVSKEVFKRWEHFPYDHRIIVLTELDAAILAMPMMRQMMSEGDQISLVTEATPKGGYKPKLWTTFGKAVYAATTANEELEHQFGNRVTLVHLQAKGIRDVFRKSAWLKGDSTALAQVEAVMAKLRAATTARPYVELVELRPYAGKLAELWNAEHPAQQRALNDFYALWKAVTAIHSRVQTTGADYEAARLIFCGQKHKFPHSTLRVLDFMQQKAAENNGSGSALTHDELCDLAGVGDSDMYLHLQELQRRGCVTQVHRSDTTNGIPRRLPSLFELTAYGSNAIKLPTWKELLGDAYDEAEFLKGEPYNPLTGELLKGFNDTKEAAVDSKPAEALKSPVLEAQPRLFGKVELTNAAGISDPRGGQSAG